MRLLRKIWSYMQVIGKARRNRTDLLRWLWRRPFLFGAIVAYENATFLSSRVETGLKVLAQCKVSAMVGCPF